MKPRICIAACVYPMVLIALKRFTLSALPQILLNIFAVKLFKKREP